MKESIGAGWLMTIVISFIILFSGFLALSINYAKAYRIKDGIIERIQKHNGLTCKALNDIDEYIGKIGYASKGICSLDDLNVTAGTEVKVYGINKKTSQIVEITKGSMNTTQYNYCVYKFTPKVSELDNISGSYYKVSVFFSVSLPIFRASNLFSISGETNYIPYPVAEVKNC